jgi:hemerythrin
MPIFEWNNLFLLGLKRFDEDHQHLVRLLNTTYDSFIHNGSKCNLNTVIDELSDYALYHFTEEEYWMKETGYPGLDMHISQHDIFSTRVVEFKRRHQKCDAKLTLELLTFLKEWLTDHILGSDKEFGFFIASRGGDALLSKTACNKVCIEN